jgi:hypothetical protein
MKGSLAPMRYVGLGSIIGLMGSTMMESGIRIKCMGMGC